MDGDVDPGAFLEGVQSGADLGDRFVGAVEGGAEDGDDADGVLVAERGGGLGVEVEAVASTMGTSRASTSQKLQNFSQQTWTLTPITRLGRAPAR